MQPACEYCGCPIRIVPGHRHRRYCDDRCKQMAYRRWHGQKARPTKADKEMWETLMRLQKIQEMWPDLSFATHYLLQGIQSKHGTILMLRVAERFRWEINYHAPLDTALVHDD